MEGKEEGQYQVAITKPAEISFYEILDYLYDQYSIDRAEEIASGLRDKAKELKHQPERGTIEPRLSIYYHERHTCYNHIFKSMS